MNTSERERIITLITLNAKLINNSSNLNHLISEHEKILYELYSRNPLFYKMLFKHFRFKLTSIISCIYYCSNKASIKDIQEFVSQQEKSISMNTLNSLILQLCVTRRIEIYKDENNRKERLYRPSKKGYQETYEVVQSLLQPWLELYGITDDSVKNTPETLLPQFFSRYSDIILNNITIKDLLPDSELFIEKDAGHMIVLIMYLEYIKQNSQRIMLSYRKIASYSHVSRSHICSLLKEAQAVGFIIVENNLFIMLTEKFITTFRMYFSLHFAQVLYSVNLEPDFLQQNQEISEHLINQ